MLSLMLSQGNPKVNKIATAEEYFRRATELRRAEIALMHKYTYEIIEVSPAKQAARKQLGIMAAEIIGDLASDLFRTGVKLYSSAYDDQTITSRADVVEESAYKEDEAASQARQDPSYIPGIDG